MAKAWWPSLAVVGVLGSIFAALAPSLVQRYHLPLPAAIGIYFCFLTMLLLIVAPGIRCTREWIDRRLPARLLWVILPLLWCSPYLVYAAGTGRFPFSGFHPAARRWFALAFALLLRSGS